ncbi:sigma-70 family RNA polymerase sigma factor [Stieleria varia]|uniref:ECF RNA polymerase sigma factor SigE n=1 Tax=Stieleria varia TaxID=2528005 RepID=A0A5C6B2F3_9BACT|nr:sigma-70 family RNA polymerase sigma factor [Stieleria varia]TWU06323.1 ECF RNA polymerase sigma factor SigE [Stieleria varia]
MSQWPETSESLILRIRDPRDQRAWSQFIAIYQPVVFRLARMHGLQHADAEDLCQRVFISVTKAAESWEPQDGGPRFRNWLGRVARNSILNAVTRVKPDRALGGSSAGDRLLRVPDGDEMTTAIRSESRMEAFRWAAVQVQAEFNASTWTMFHETTIGNRSVAEVAAELGINSWIRTAIILNPLTGASQEAMVCKRVSDWYLPGIPINMEMLWRSSFSTAVLYARKYRLHCHPRFSSAKSVAFDWSE